MPLVVYLFKIYFIKGVNKMGIFDKILKVVVIVVVVMLMKLQKEIL